MDIDMVMIAYECGLEVSKMWGVWIDNDRRSSIWVALCQDYDHRDDATEHHHNTINTCLLIG
jgi:hypothetical protein